LAVLPVPGNQRPLTSTHLHVLFTGDVTKTMTHLAPPISGRSLPQPLDQISANYYQLRRLTN